MMVAGCDVGSLTSKAVIMGDGKIVASVIIKSKARPGDSADAAMGQALSKAGLSMNDIACCVGTGYGRDRISFVKEAVTEIACHAKGAQWLVPSARTVIDIGGQDCKAMRLDARGNMVKFTANDKCASGTGRFLEVMARVLHVELDDLGTLSASSRSAITLASACTVWAQADVIQHLNSGVPVADIAAGINSAMASRMSVIVNNIGFERDVVMTGGVAKNAGVVAALEKLLGLRIKRVTRADPQLAGAIGAALIAGERAQGGKS
ncbi:MAG TPA: acyl-CoA dehydratase activase [Spirochaetota bacterium]|nr:acyl-CoA dehydratase activase [Spirochaetota bacterium]HPC39611.1 acyl-CoA dehydratase activase [Spirochaetota bacterium]HQF09507.1 acyl-CoA dehydratase activase [Spirochaetota bacterium]HQH98190.1 acyl-CoA dehydratase activase [Spirochaetota bacterium]HQJ72368.1 acyl-CoA dehydratase activase [Spirochaetota bacterium]